MQIKFNLSDKFKFLGQGNVLYADTWFHWEDSGTISTFLKFQKVNGLEDFRHVLVDFRWAVTIRQNVKQVTDWNEVESWEGFSFWI